MYTHGLKVEHYAKTLYERIKKRNRVVRAWMPLDMDMVIEQARALDQMPVNKRGPLFGVGVGIKDNMTTKHFPTWYGSPLWFYNQPDGCDAAVVGMLKAAGALIIGKTITTELGVYCGSTLTRNPHVLDRIAGGSSSGSAAAVADFHVPLSVGTQTAGNIICPASYTGVVGMKPTYNVVSVEGIKPVAPSFDTVGFFARNVRDLEIVAKIVGIVDHGPPVICPAVLQGLSIAFIQTPVWEQSYPETRSAFISLFERLRSMGVRVEVVELPNEFTKAGDHDQCLGTVIRHETSISFRREYMIHDLVHDTQDPADPAGLKGLGPEFTRLRSDAVSGEAYTGAMMHCDILRCVWELFASNYAAIIAPSALGLAPIGTDPPNSEVFNAVWTMLHVPVVNIPASKYNGLPVGLSVVGRRYHDQQLLKICNELFKACLLEL